MFLSKLKKKGKKIAVISAENVKTIKKKKKINYLKNMLQNLPPRFKKKVNFQCKFFKK